MKKMLIAGVALCATTAVSFAGSLTVGEHVYISTSVANRQGSGGEFAMTEINADNSVTSGGYQFNTFCVEKTDSLAKRSTIVGISGKVLLDDGTFKDFKGGDINNTRAAFRLFREWALGFPIGGTKTLFMGTSNAVTYTYDGSATGKQNAEDLQSAIWNLLGFTTSLNANALAYQTAALSEAAFAYTGVAILNLVDKTNTSSNTQDQLYWTGGGDNFAVPEPSTFAMFAIGMVGAGVAMRRRRNS